MTISQYEYERQMLDQELMKQQMMQQYANQYQGGLGRVQQEENQRIAKQAEAHKKATAQQRRTKLLLLIGDLK